MKKKYDEQTALAKILVLIKNHYEKIGRQEIEDADEERQNLIDNIEEILNNTEISTRHIIIEKLENDDEISKSLKGRWKADGTFR